ncbi:putative peptidase [Candidatus Termititenax persephonae]|uniref:Peptidase n=1 Tax=Candidatus Termititenax persephonae TaxID=2218525 RepID=A0A388TGY6_9BACT|nr:putative peptidase [Candidatus Termititenax persephonae]
MLLLPLWAGSPAVGQLLAGVTQVLLRGNALPILTGAWDERLERPASSYYRNITALADGARSRVWRAYANSRRQTLVYSAAQAVDLALLPLSAGQRKYFYDESSGRKYWQADRRAARAAFFADYAADRRLGVDDYLENILLPPAPYLADLFAVDLPDLPNPHAEKFVPPPLKVNPLPRPDPVPRELDSFQWKVKPEVLYGARRQIAPDVFIPETDFAIALKIISPQGEKITSAEALDGLIPLVAIVPLPASSPPRLVFKPPKVGLRTTRNLAFVEETLRQTAAGQPWVVDYVLPESVQSVEFAVLDGQGRPLYLRRESSPDPRAPLPFVWRSSGQGKDFYATLKGYDRQNTVTETVPRQLRLAGSADQDLSYQQVANEPFEDYYGLVELSAIWERQGLHKIYFWLYGTEDASGKPLAGSIYATFSSFDPLLSSVSAPSETPRGVRQKIKVRLLDPDGQPIAAARTEFFSSRNRQKTVDKFWPPTAYTDARGEAEVEFVSEIVGEAEISVVSNQVRVKASPALIKVRE